MDLKDSVCERVVSEFLDDKKPIENVSSDMMGDPTIVTPPINYNGTATYMGHGAMGYSNTNVATYSSGTSTSNIYAYTINGASGTSGVSEVVLNSNDVVLRDNTIDLRATGF